MLTAADLQLRRKNAAQIRNATSPKMTMLAPMWVELGRPINDQYPYVSDVEFEAANKFVRFERPEWMADRIIME